jgi:multiple sugar transport system substrate-binding protein
MGTMPEPAWHEQSVTRRAMLRRAGVAGVALAGSPLLTACGGTSSGSGTIEFWDMVWGGDDYESAAHALIAEFEKAQPGIKVNYRLLPWTSFYEVFATAVSSGTTPDVSTGATYQGFQYAKSLLPVNATIDAWQKGPTGKDVLPVSIAAQRDASGDYLGLPWAVECRVISYRKDYFAASNIPVPTSLTELGQAARALTRNGRYGLGFSGETLGSQMLMSFFFNNGGGLFTAGCQADLVNDRNREVCAWVQALVRDGAIPKAAAGWGIDDVANAMKRGDIAMCHNVPNWFHHLGDAGPHVDVLPPPTGFHGDKGTIVWYGPMMLYRSVGSDQDKALTFMNWWLDHQYEMWSNGEISTLPARRSFYEKVPALQDPRVRRVRDQWVPVGKTLSAPCDHALESLNKVEGQGFMQTLVQDILTLRPIDAALNKANAALREAAAHA